MPDREPNVMTLKSLISPKHRGPRIADLSHCRPSEVHALVTAVLLRMSRLDAFDRNAEAKPPDRELGEIEQGIGTGEGNAVVGADRERQASLTEQSFEGRTGEVFAGRLQGFAQEQET